MDQTSATRIHIATTDPQGPAALALLREAAIEARALYPEQFGPHDPWPSNAPTPPRGVYLLAHVDDEPAGMGAHRPLDATSTEVRRMFVRTTARRAGVARHLLAALEAHARAQGFAVLRLETGHRQTQAMQLYASCGFVRIEPFGVYVNDPVSVCYEKRL